jgi:hypothetical protein
VRLRVTYDGVDEFLRDHQEQIVRGGLLVRGDVPPGLERGAAVELELVTPVGSVTLAGQVIQVLAGAGVAVTVDPGAVSKLAEAARAAGQPRAPQRAAARTTGSPDAPAPEPHGAALARKIQLALHGDKNQRAALMREQNKMIHGYVVRNAQIQLDEVVAIARMPTVNVDVLNFIAGRREWAERPEVAIALVRNPRTPVPMAIRLLERVSPSDLRALAKQSTVREAIQRAARKKVIG